MAKSQNHESAEELSCLLERAGKSNIGKFILYRDGGRKKFTFGKGCINYTTKVDLMTPPGYQKGTVKLGDFKETYREFADGLTADEADAVRKTVEDLYCKKQS